MVGLILAFIFLTPREWFRDQPKPSSVIMLEAHAGADLLWIAPELLAGIPDEEKMAKATALVEAKLARRATVVRLDTILDSENEPTGYMVLLKP
jgi:hypothetical protein